jgi:hypothetical protein
MSPDSTTNPTNDKQITIEVPEDRVAEFYAFYGRFLAGAERRHGRGRGHRHGHRCGGGHHRGEPRESAPGEPETQTA